MLICVAKVTCVKVSAQQCKSHAVLGTSGQGSSCGVYQRSVVNLLRIGSAVTDSELRAMARIGPDNVSVRSSGGEVQQVLYQGRQALKASSTYRPTAGCESLVVQIHTPPPVPNQEIHNGNEAQSS